MTQERVEEQRRAHSLADEFAAIAEDARGQSYRRWANAVHHERAWRQYAYLLSTLPEVV